MADAGSTHQSTPGEALTNAAKIVGELAVVPGVSLAVDGDVKSGVLHAGTAIAAAIVLGPVLGPLAWIATGLDSYSKSVTGKHIHEVFKPAKA
jgi:hypothetical protein